VRSAGVLAAIVAALVLQTTLASSAIGGLAAPDLVVVVVVSVALVLGPVAGMFAGSAAGLMQDALSSGVVGVGGLAKSIVGFLAGVIGQQFIVTALLPRFVMFVGATALHALVFLGTYAVLGLRTFDAPYAALGTQALGNAVIGVTAFALAESLPGALERRRASRRSKRR